MGIKEELDKLYGVTDDEIDEIILEKKIEEEEKKLEILKELRKYRTFEEYVSDHEQEFNDIEISDDFRIIIISEDVYPNLKLDLIKKMEIIADHYGLLIYIIPFKEEKIPDKFKVRQKEMKNGN